MKTITVTRALSGKLLSLVVGTFAVEEGPHGGAVILYGGQRIGVVETCSQVLYMMEEASKRN